MAKLKWKQWKKKTIFFTLWKNRMPLSSGSTRTSVNENVIDSEPTKNRILNRTHVSLLFHNPHKKWITKSFFFLFVHFMLKKGHHFHILIFSLNNFFFTIHWKKELILNENLVKFEKKKWTTFLDSISVRNSYSNKTNIIKFSLRNLESTFS